MNTTNYKGKQLLDVIKGWNDIERAKIFLDIPTICRQLTEEFNDDESCDETMLSFSNSLWEEYEAVQIPFMEANPSADWDEEVEKCELWISDFYAEKGI